MAEVYCGNSGSHNSLEGTKGEFRTGLTPALPVAKTTGRPYTGLTSPVLFPLPTNLHTTATLLERSEVASLEFWLPQPRYYGLYLQGGTDSATPLQYWLPQE
jgi:hypothetical protein